VVRFRPLKPVSLRILTEFHSMQRLRMPQITNQQAARRDRQQGKQTALVRRQEKRDDGPPRPRLSLDGVSGAIRDQPTLL
jgi:hypothetical protein